MLANIAAMYAVYHGPKGLKKISERVHGLACIFAEGLKKMDYDVKTENFFDTITIRVEDAKKVFLYLKSYLLL